MTLREQLQASLAASYILDRELGGGGMSRVFVAEEKSLGRRVVVKVLPPDLSAVVSIDRFKREITLLAALQHPHIVPVLSAGETDGLPYYVMPFIDGESLRARLARGPLSISEVVRVVRQVTSALAYAHSRGVVHRDIKPDNVLISGDAAVVTDFGIAKALSAATSDDGGAKLTGIGVTLGTPGYMAPEQASADPRIDHRVDLYALGCMAYELLTGQPPFADRPAAQLLAAHLTEAPVPVEEKRSDVPPALAALVARCLSKSPEQRPATSAEVSQVLDSIPISSGHVAATSAHRTATRSRAKVFGAIGVAALGLVAAGLAWRSRSRDTAPPLIAVVPFENQGPEAEQYFAAGLSQAISNRLTGLSGVRVIDWQSAVSAAKGGTSARDAGRLLGAHYVLRATVQWAGTGADKRAQVMPALVRVADGTNEWTTDPIAVTPGDVFAVQTDIAIRVAQALDVAVGSREKATLVERPTRDAEAYDLYLRGIAAWDQIAGSLMANPFAPVAEQARAKAFFEAAMKRDPRFVEAGARWLFLTANLAFSGEAGPAADSLEKVAKWLLREAPSNADVVLGVMTWLATRGSLRAADSLLARAASEHPNDARIIAAAAMSGFLVSNRVVNPGPELERALKLAPRNLEVLNVAGTGFDQLRRFDEAQEIDARILAISPADAAALERDMARAVLRGDSAAILPKYHALLRALGHPTIAAVYHLSVGTEPARQALATIPLASIPKESLADSTIFFIAQARRRLMTGDRAGATKYFKLALTTAEAGTSAADNVPKAMLAWLQAIAAAGAGENIKAQRASEAAADYLRRTYSQGVPMRTTFQCSAANMHAMLGDTTRMYPALEVCLRDPGGSTPAATRRDPAYIPYRGQLHFQRLTNDITPVKKKGG